jgi:trehalose 6-phosphate phosphatase
MKIRFNGLSFFQAATSRSKIYSGLNRHANLVSDTNPPDNAKLTTYQPSERIMPAALPLLDSDDALFLDFDGSLVEIALTPDDVVVTPSLLALLQNLEARLNGAVAIVSGRPITELDSQLAPLQLAAAGEHGAELRRLNKGPIEQSVDLPVSATQQLRALNEQLPGTALELKTAAAALHFRAAPQHEHAAVAGIRALAQQHAGYELMHGKMVAEFKPAGINKGMALAELAAQAPFAGRRPVFIGDDVTDEAGFMVVNELGGLSIRVGKTAATKARYYLADVTEVHCWLAELG